MWPLVVNIFEPLISQSSPSRTARVDAAATSDPHSGSLKPSAMVTSPPFAAPSSTRSRTKAVPTCRTTDATIRVVSPPRYIGASARCSSAMRICV